ncbi:MAG TPA: YggT family protein [Anaerolineae bacterium]|nr:YggT family protein [Anaerolineae bacterium]
MNPAVLFSSLFNLLYWGVFILLMARMVLSWTNIGGYQLRSWVYRLTEPLLQPIRNLLPQSGGVDFSPMVLMFGLIFLRRILAGILF